MVNGAVKEIKQNKGMGNVYVAHTRVVEAGLREEMTLSRDVNQVWRTRKVWGQGGEAFQERKGPYGGSEAVIQLLLLSNKLP